jgi:hypothetical protein
VADKPKPTGADKPEPELEKLVARRIREQLGEGGLQKLIGARQQIQAKMEASGTVTRAGELTALERAGYRAVGLAVAARAQPLRLLPFHSAHSSRVVTTRVVKTG